MWFKQAQFFKIPSTIRYETSFIAEQLNALSFTPCLATLPASQGWVSPIEEEGSLVHASGDFLLFCMQLEEKILPASVVRQAVDEKIKAMAKHTERKLTAKQKYALKEEMIYTLLPRAFTRLARTYAYIDIKDHWLVIDTANASRSALFMELLNRSLPDIIPEAVTLRLAPILTQWLTHQNYPTTFSMEKSCVLADPTQRSRIIRCQQQDLLAQSVQSLFKDSFEVKELALAWEDRVKFKLADDFSWRSIQYTEQITEQAQEMEPETQQQQMSVDFLIMSATLKKILTDLMTALPNEEIT